MNVLRRTKIDTDILMVGDQISVGHYTATCQKVEADGYIFLLDQYLDEPMKMKNDEDTNDGGYEASDLRKRLNSAEILAEFSGIELIPFRNGDLLRIPYYGEMFGHDDWYKNFAEPDDCEQWELMDHVNRIAYRRGKRDRRTGHARNVGRGACGMCARGPEAGACEEGRESDAENRKGGQVIVTRRMERRDSVLEGTQS